MLHKYHVHHADLQQAPKQFLMHAQWQSLSLTRIWILEGHHVRLVHLPIRFFPLVTSWREKYSYKSREKHAPYSENYALCFCLHPTVSVFHPSIHQAIHLRVFHSLYIYITIQVFDRKWPLSTIHWLVVGFGKSNFPNLCFTTTSITGDTSSVVTSSPASSMTHILTLSLYVQSYCFVKFF